MFALQRIVPKNLGPCGLLYIGACIGILVCVVVLGFSKDVALLRYFLLS